MLKQLVRYFFANNSSTHRMYVYARSFYHRIRKLLFYISDAKKTYRDMRWGANDNSSYWPISSEMLFQYHKLEKGLCMPGEKRFFGYDPAKATLDLLEYWRKLDYSLDDPVYLGALETLYSYRDRLDETPPVHGEQLKQLLDEEIQCFSRRYELQTPVPVKHSKIDDAFSMIERIAFARRSVRSFKPIEVDVEIIYRAVKISQLSPSACNRQPWRAHMYRDKTLINGMLKFQNGNRGFGHTIPMLLVLTAEASSFFDASERHEPYIDGGLFAMSLILALQSLGVSSCCLNWCVEPLQDRLAHEYGNICESERIIMYLAVGYAEDAALVPRSPRRDINTVISDHKIL